MKATTDDILANERDMIVDALCDGTIELNDEFLNRYAGERLRAALNQIPEKSRAYYVDSNIDPDKCFFNVTIPSLDDNCVLIPSAEIEVQFEGRADDFFEKPGEFTIDGNLAYLYTGYGLTVPVDIDRMMKSFADDNQR